MITPITFELGGKFEFQDPMLVIADVGQGAMKERNNVRRNFIRALTFELGSKFVFRDPMMVIANVGQGLIE